MEVRKSRFDTFTPEEKNQYISRLRERIRAGYLQSEKVLDGIAEKLAGSFEDELAKYT
jgi:hypothetical protein